MARVIGPGTLLVACSALSACTGPPASTTTQQPRPLPSPTATLEIRPESVSWSGAVTGALTTADVTCNSNPGLPANFIALHSIDGAREIDIAHHGAGVTMAAPDVQTVSLQMNVGGQQPARSGTMTASTATIYLAVSGTVTYGSTGNSGSMDVLLAPDSDERSLPSPNVHMIGNWSCR